MDNPKIRFKGFTDAWEQRKIGSISTIIAGGTPNTKEISYWNPKEIPWLSSGEVHKKYIYDTNDMISEKGLNNSSAKWVEKNSVLIALAGQGKTRGTSAITRMPITTNQSIAAIKFDDILYPDYAFQNLDSRYDELRNISSGDETRGGLNKQLLSDLEITFPSFEEQKKIGNYFCILDYLITLHQRKCDKIKELKKYMLQKMFPQNGMNVPEIRFNRFTDAWKQRKFEELYKKSSEKNDGSIGMDKNITVATMQYKEDVKVSTDDYLKTYYTFKLGDIAFEGHQNKEFRFGRFVENDIGDGIVSHIFSVFRPIVDYDLNFWKYAINHKSLMQRVLSRSTKASTMMHDLVTNDFLNEEFRVPKLEEQKKIGQYFSHLDHLITLHQQKCNQLLNIKKFMLEKMFL